MTDDTRSPHSSATNALPLHVTAEELPCQIVVERLTDYLDDALSAQERDLLGAHLALCGDCTTYLKQLQMIIAALPAEVTTTPSPALLHHLLAAFESGASS